MIVRLPMLLISILLAACTAETPDAAQAPMPPAATATQADAAAPSASVASAASGGWRYGEGSADGGAQTASIASTDGKATLVFRSDPTWGRSAYLELAGGDVDCPTGCQAQVSVDGGSASNVVASRPQAPQPRLSLREPETLWTSLQGADTLTIEYPAAGATGRAQFKVSGADPGKLPGWD